MYEEFFLELFTEYQQGFLSVVAIAGGNFEEQILWHPDALDEIAHFIEQRRDKANLYFCPHLLTEKRRKKEYAASAQDILWADLDECPPDVLLAEPTFTIQSSEHKYQALWRLAQPTTPDRIESLNQRIAYYHAPNGADRTGWDLTQLLRVPNTYNFKYDPPQPVILEQSNNKNYPLKALTESYPELQRNKESEKPTTTADPERLLSKLPSNLHTLYYNTPTYEDDWSKQLWNLELSLAENGLPIEEAYAIVRNAACNKFSRDRRGDDAVWADLNRAYAQRPQTLDTEILEFFGESAISWDAFWQMDHSGEDWLIEPLVPTHRSVAVYAQAGQGKSEFVLFFAAQHAPQLSIVYLDYEMTEDDLKDRLEAMGYGPNSDLTNLSYHIMPPTKPLDTPKGGEQVARLARARNADLVIIDTVSRVLEGAENDSDTFRNFHRHTGHKLKAEGRSLLRIDHAGKDEEKGQRGSSGKDDDVDVVWKLSARNNLAKLKARKRRMSWVPQEHSWLRLEEPLRYERYGGQQAELPSEKAKEIIDALDELGIPNDASNRATQDALRGHSSVDNTILQEAVRHRKRRT